MANDEFKKGEVYLYKIKGGEAIGTEIQKIRPAVIISNNKLNKWGQRFVIIPITKTVSKFYSFEVPVRVNERVGKAVIDQIKAVDRSRLIRKLGKLTVKEMDKIKDKIKSLLM